MSEKPAPKTAAKNSDEKIVEFPRDRIASANKARALAMGPINQLELTSIKALTSYVAHNKNVPEDVVRTFFQAEFNIADAANLRRDDYERAIRFLIDLRTELLIN